MSALILRPGRPAVEVLAECLPKEIATLSWPKNMFWRGGAPERFVRPVRWITAMLGSAAVPIEYGGVMAGVQTRGHRILGAVLKLAQAADYRAALEKVSDGA